MCPRYGDHSQDETMQPIVQTHAPVLDYQGVLYVTPYLRMTNDVWFINLLINSFAHSIYGDVPT